MKNRDGGIVGYNVQAAVDAEHHLIVAHEVITDGVDRDLLTPMAEQARDAIGIRMSDRGGRPRLLQERADPPVRGRRHHADRAQAADVQCRGRGPLRQDATSSTSPGMMSTAARRRACDQTLHHRRGRSDAGCVLDLGLSALRAEGAVHDHRLPPHPTLAARSGARGDAGAPRPAT